MKDLYALARRFYKLATEEISCPVRSKMYGGMPSCGGYRSITEFEIGAQRIAEAAHCILGSLGKHGSNWERMKRSEAAHIEEEMEIIVNSMNEYSRDIYTDMVGNPGHDYKPEYKEHARMRANETVESIRANSPKLREMAKKAAIDTNKQPDIPMDVKKAAIGSYAVIATLAGAMAESVKDYPNNVTNPYQNPEFRKMVHYLQAAVRDLLL